MRALPIQARLNPSVIGVGYKIVSCFAFAAINMVAKYLSGGSNVKTSGVLSPYTLMTFQNLIGFLCLLPWVAPELSLSKFKQNYFYTTRIGLLNCARLLVTTGGVALWYLSISKMPIHQVLAIGFISPVITTLAAVIFLQEDFTIRRRIVVLLSLLGGFLMTRPDVALTKGGINLGWYFILPIAANLLFSIDKVIVRKLLLQQQSALVTTTYLMLFAVPICALCSWFDGSWQVPVSSDIGYLFLLGIFNAIANFTLSQSLKYSDITLVLPYGILKLVFNNLLAYLIFHEAPKTASMLIGFMIACATTLVLF